MTPAGFFPLGSRARWAIALLALTIAVDLLSIAFDLSEISLLQKVIDGEFVSSDSLVDSDDRQTIAGLLQLVMLIVTAIAFIRWFHAAYRNLASLGVSAPRFKAGWAIGAWFVPFLNLWRPKQIANDIWRGSDPTAPAVQGSNWVERPVAGLLTLWWAVWIIGSYAGNIAARAWFNADTASELRSGDQFDVTVLVLDIAGAVLAMLVIRKTTARQAERANLLATLPPVEPVAPSPLERPPALDLG